MSTRNEDKKLVVIQLSGGNDYLNTVIPYEDGNYHDFRTTVKIEPEKVMPIENGLGFNPALSPIKSLWDQGKVAIINGIGYENPNRSHFRSMDIWHTAEPDKIATEGWLGKVIKGLDPNKDNVLTGVNFGRGLPRSLSSPGVPVASVGDLSTYGLYPDLEDARLKEYALEAFANMYGGGQGRDAVMEFLGQTGKDALKGADILRTAPGKYSSNVEYADNPIAQKLKSVSQVMFADLGTRIYYTDHGSFDTHAGELEDHTRLWNEVAGAVGDFYDDLKEHGKEKEVMVLIWSEFGRRIMDNGSGTDHGSGGGAFVIGDPVHGGMYGSYPSLNPEDQLEGDLHFNNDFRCTYSTIAEQWMGLEPEPIVNGRFEQIGFMKNGNNGH